MLRYCCPAGAYVGGAEVLGSVLKDSQLPHVQQILNSPDMLEQLGGHDLLRLVKAFLQVKQLGEACEACDRSLSNSSALPLGLAALIQTFPHFAARKERKKLK